MLNVYTAVGAGNRITLSDEHERRVAVRRTRRRHTALAPPLAAEGGEKIGISRAFGGSDLVMIHESLLFRVIGFSHLYC